MNVKTAKTSSAFLYYTYGNKISFFFFLFLLFFCFLWNYGLLEMVLHHRNTLILIIQLLGQEHLIFTFITCNALVSWSLR